VGWLILSEENFSGYFKKLRVSKSKTQEDIANAIGKHKMLISGIEHGKNNPPREGDLEKIAFELKLNEEESITLFEMAAFHRGTLPKEVVTYIMKNNMVFELIKTVKNKQFNNEEIKEVVNFCNSNFK
jgi:transcriptional regulator with XRE-family HTH domain